MMERVRIQQQWDADLHRRAQVVAGKHGLTRFTVAAVRASLGTGPTAAEEARTYAQRVTDALAMMSPDDDPRLILELLQPPEWIDTSQFPWSSGVGRAGHLRPTSSPAPGLDKQAALLDKQADERDESLAAQWCPQCREPGVVQGACWLCGWTALDARQNT